LYSWGAKSNPILLVASVPHQLRQPEIDKSHFKGVAMKAYKRTPNFHWRTCRLTVYGEKYRREQQATKCGEPQDQGAIFAESL
jgi:hypothetical protein